MVGNPTHTESASYGQDRSNQESRCYQYEKSYPSLLALTIHDILISKGSTLSTLRGRPVAREHLQIVEFLGNFRLRYPVQELAHTRMSACLELLLGSQRHDVASGAHNNTG